MERSYSLQVDRMFDDRRDAGQALASALVRQGVTCSAVLGLVRGGVPVASEVATALNAPLDVLGVKKLRAPISEELAIGAICADGARILHQESIKELGVSQWYLDQEIRDRLVEAQKAEKLYRGSHPALEVAGGAVIIVDDGIATGATMEAGVLSVRQRGAKTIMVAIPVGSRHACDALRRTADEVFCLSTPVDFWAVGQFYRHFAAVPDQEIRQLLDQSRAVRAKAADNA